MSSAQFPVPAAFPFPAPLKGGAGKTGKPGSPEKSRFGNFGKLDWVPESERPRRPYRFRLCAGQGGGVYLTQAESLRKARAELLSFYGHRLRSVCRCGGEG